MNAACNLSGAMVAVTCRSSFVSPPTSIPCTVVAATSKPTRKKAPVGRHLLSRYVASAGST